MRNFVIAIIVLFSYWGLAELFVAFLGAKTSVTFEPDKILLLGANGNRQSPVVQDRVSQAIAAIQKYPSAKLVITGNEKTGEITAYRTLLAEQGYQPESEEPEARTTWENIVNSEAFVSPGQKVLIVTTEYHQPRAVAMARSRGWIAEAFGTDPRQYQNRAFFFFKERLSNMRYFPILFWNWIQH